MHYVKIGIRYFIGLVFITSAVLKLIDVDAFEIYIFSQGFLSLSLSSILARLIISGEAMLGMLLILKWRYTLVHTTLSILLLAFSGYLILQIGKGETANCHCFGTMISMSPVASLVKNILLLGGLLFIRKQNDSNWKHLSSAALFIIVFTLATPSIFSPPDFLMQYPAMPESVIVEANKRYQETPALQQLIPDDGKYILCMYSVSCTYCKQAAEKISIIADRHHLEDRVRCVFTGDSALMHTFWAESQGAEYPYIYMPMRSFFSIAGPSVPSIYLVDNGQIVQHFHFRSIDETIISDFFNHENL